ncbi:MAG: hypothetical protein AAF958_10940 [Planctomycetota bacterium]
MNAIATSKRTILWIDACGGFGLLRQPEVRIGREGNDINLMADVSRHAGTLIRRGEDWAWQTSHSTSPKEKRTDWLTLPGKLPLPNVNIQLSQPHPLSSTTVLRVAPPHRLADSLDGMLLVGSVIVIGPSPDCHCVVRHADSPLTLRVTETGIRFRHAGSQYELSDDQTVRAGWLTVRQQTLFIPSSP